MKSLTIIVIGGGAAGFFAAINCAQQYPEHKVILLEKSSKLLSKVRVSGGGRCNVTNASFHNSQLLKNYPRGEKALKTAFNKFTVNDTIQWFEKRGVALKTEEDGRMFPVTDNSETIIDCLLKEAQRSGLTIRTNMDVISIEKMEHEFSLEVRNEEKIFCDRLLIATGGNSKDSAYDWLKNLGHTIERPVPSLFTLNIPDSDITQLMGISVPMARIKIVGTKLAQLEPLLITHWGMSGPGVLKLSAWGARILNELNYSFSISVNWTPDFCEDQIRQEFQEMREIKASQLIHSSRIFNLPKRLWEYFLIKAGINVTCRWADLPKKNTNVLINILINDEYKVKGRTTYKEEFVTCGGVNLNEINFNTMGSTKIPNLYFAGEVVDIDGVTGGFNFQNAWTTGWIAGMAMGIS